MSGALWGELPELLYDSVCHRMQRHYSECSFLMIYLKSLLFDPNGDTNGQKDIINFLNYYYMLSKLKSQVRHCEHFYDVYFERTL